MSERKLEIVRKAAHLFEVGDWAEFGAMFTEDAVFVVVEGWPEPGPFHGRAAIVEEFRRLQGSWATNTVVIGDHTGRGDRLALSLRWVVEGASSGAPAELTVFAAYRFEGDRIAEWRAYWSQSDALEAAGLSAAE